MIDMDNPVLDLTAMDRCSRCGAQALVLAEKENNNEELQLFFCGHHAKSHKEALSNTGWTLIVDGAMAEAAGYKDDSVMYA